MFGGKSESTKLPHMAIHRRYEWQRSKRQNRDCNQGIDRCTRCRGEGRMSLYAVPPGCWSFKTPSTLMPVAESLASFLSLRSGVGRP